ncbi:hypothetical protein Ndes2526A_g00388 [Nannochloris sp. 'desiccata']|nr:hypothetical protein KSW81_003171 [Chlorella desiccata (nom. nud.)]
MTLGFGSKGHEHEHEDPNLVLAQLNEQLSPNLKQALINTDAISRPEDEAHVQSVLNRFLVADKFDVERTLLRLEKHAAWRQQNVPKGGIPETSVLDQINQHKVLLQPKGPDGRPLLIIRVARHFATTTTGCETFVTFCLEAASRLCDTAPVGDGKLLALFDLQGAKWANMDRHALSSCFSILEREFPERIHKIFMYDAPTIFDLLWKIVSPFVDPHTRKKVAFIQGLEPFLNVVDKSIVPEVYGGVCEEVAVEVAVRRMHGSREEVEKVIIEDKDSPAAVLEVGA